MIIHIHLNLSGYSLKDFLMVISDYRKNHEKGQGLVEYALILALLALVVLAAMKILAPAIGNVFSQISGPLSGEDGGPPVIATPTSTPTPTWTTCASENQFCDFSGTALVRYGADDSWFTGTFTDGVWCTNSVFGDPLVGTVKSCQISGGSGGPTATVTPTLTPTRTPTLTPSPTPTLTPTPTWITCANENYFCSFSGTALVRYGALGIWTTGTFTDGVWCANSVFGDPLYGVYKSCQYSQ